MKKSPPMKGNWAISTYSVVCVCVWPFRVPRGAGLFIDIR